MSKIIRNVSQSVKDSARDVAGLVAAGVVALVLGAVAAAFLGWAVYLGLSRVMDPAWAAALVGLGYILIIGIAYFIIRSKTAEDAEERRHEKAAASAAPDTPPWVAYGIPAEWPVDKVTQQLKVLGLSALGRMSARVSARAALPLLAPAAVGIVGFIFARRLTNRFSNGPRRRYD